jgi:hypothetical protein
MELLELPIFEVIRDQFLQDCSKFNFKAFENWYQVKFIYFCEVFIFKTRKSWKILTQLTINNAQCHDFKTRQH